MPTAFILRRTVDALAPTRQGLKRSGMFRAGELVRCLCARTLCCFSPNLARLLWLWLAVAIGVEPALAIDGGSLASARDHLARSTVAVAIVGRSAGARLGFNHCSGVLIGADLVLTAAHCVSDAPALAAVMTYDGAKPASYPFLAARVARYHIQPGYGAEHDLLAQIRALSVDVAVLRLRTRVPGRKPIPIVHAADRMPSRLLLAGAGLSRWRVGQLRTATLQPLLMTDTGLIVARALGARVCVGDSGGPVVETARGGPRLWGIASAILAAQGPCGEIVVIAPARAAVEPLD